MTEPAATRSAAAGRARARARRLPRLRRADRRPEPAHRALPRPQRDLGRRCSTRCARRRPSPPPRSGWRRPGTVDFERAARRPARPVRRPREPWPDRDPCRRVTSQPAAPRRCAIARALAGGARHVRPRALVGPAARPPDRGRRAARGRAGGAPRAVALDADERRLAGSRGARAASAARRLALPHAIARGPRDARPARASTCGSCSPPARRRRSRRTPGSSATGVPCCRRASSTTRGWPSCDDRALAAARTRSSSCCWRARGRGAARTAGAHARAAATRSLGRVAGRRWRCRAWRRCSAAASSSWRARARPRRSPTPCASRPTAARPDRGVAGARDAARRRRRSRRPASRTSR